MRRVIEAKSKSLNISKDRLQKDYESMVSLGVFVDEKDIAICKAFIRLKHNESGLINHTNKYIWDKELLLEALIIPQLFNIIFINVQDTPDHPIVMSIDEAFFVVFGVFPRQKVKLRISRDPY